MQIRKKYVNEWLTINGREKTMNVINFFAKKSKFEKGRKWMIRKLYPQGKKKAFSITYDDGVTQDVRFVELLNKYGLNGTFNLNSELMSNGFEWTHETGLVIQRLKPEVS